MRRLRNKLVHPIQYKKWLLVVTLIITATATYAGDGAAGISKATELITGYFDKATFLMYAIGAVVGIIGGVKVFQKWNSGDQDTSKVAAAWFGSCIFLVVVAAVLRSFFL